MLLRGESWIASTGLFLASILLALLGGCAWWSVEVQRKSTEIARADEIRSTGVLLARATGDLLALDDLTAVRRLLLEIGGSGGMLECAVVLPDGSIVAHSDATRITAASLPETWPQDGVGGAAQASAPAPEGSIAVGVPVTVAGRGRARLQLTGSIDHPESTYWAAQTGVGLFGAAGLLALLLVYRRMRSRVAVLSVIRDALRVLASGDTTPGALTVSDDLGGEAAAWNALVREHEEFRKQILSRQAVEILSTRQMHSSDLDSACDVMRQGLMLVDRDLHVTYANGAAGVYIGIGSDQLPGRTIGDLITEERVLNTLRAIAAGTLRTWTSVEIEQFCEEARGVLRFSMRPLRDGDASAAVIVIEDVTQQRVADDSRNAFVTQATHELRSPLTNIRLYAEMAMEDGTSAEELHKCLNVVNQEARRLERVVGDMLSIAEIEAGKYQLAVDDIRLDAVFESLRGDYSAAARKKKISLGFELPPKLPIIQGDHEKVALALHNLVGNAIKYTPDEGKVTVHVEAENEEVVVEVRDSGIGIRDEECERIFERFYRASDDRVANVTGSGLGLAMAREVVRMHGGDITVESELNKGSTFVLTLPTEAKAA